RVALEGTYRLGDFGSGGKIAQSPARHGVRLGNAVYRYGEVLHFGGNGAYGEGFFTAVDKFFVNLVGEHEYVVLFADGSYRPDFIFGVHRARGVAGGVED